MALTRARKVQMIGYYGWGNFGDDLFVETIRAKQGQLWPGARSRTFLPCDVGAHSLPGVWGSANRLSRAIAGAVWADTFALCGGSVLSDLSGVMRVRSKLAGVRDFEALGVSVGPFNSDTDRNQVNEFLAGFRRVVVRDRRSAERFGKDLDVGGDLAALSPRMNVRASTGALTLAPSVAAKVPASRLVAQVVDALRSAGGGAPRSINVLALNKHPKFGDEELCREVARGLDGGGFHVNVTSYGELGIDGTVELLGTSAAVWAQRLHAAIVAYLCGVPFMLVGHHEKCIDFASDIGLESALIVDSMESWSSGANLTLENDGQGLWQVEPADYSRRARRVYGVE